MCELVRGKTCPAQWLSAPRGLTRTTKRKRFFSSSLGHLNCYTAPLCLARRLLSLGRGLGCARSAPSLLSHSLALLGLQLTGGRPGASQLPSLCEPTLDNKRV